MRCWVFLAVACVAGSAAAGPLGKVVGGIHGKAAGSSGGARPGGVPTPGQPGPIRPPPQPTRPGTVIVAPSPAWLYWPPPLALGYYAYAPYGEVAVYDEGPPPGPAPEPFFLELYLGAQSVKDSDHSLSFEVRLRRAWASLSAYDTSFFEKEPGSSLTTRLDLWSISPGVRLIQGESSRLWVEVGFAGVHTVPDLSIHGANGAVRMEHDLGEDLALDVLGRAYAFRHDLRALELGIGVRWSILRLSWRQVEFNVGPPLRGPEIGVALLF